jgi:hypothetical protein
MHRRVWPLSFREMAAGNRVDRERAAQRLARLGYRDGGQALWSYTLDVLRPQRPLLTFLAIKLKRARVLDGAAIDAIVSRHRWRCS